MAINASYKLDNFISPIIMYINENLVMADYIHFHIVGWRTESFSGSRFVWLSEMSCQWWWRMVDGGANVGRRRVRRGMKQFVRILFWLCAEVCFSREREKEKEIWWWRPESVAWCTLWCGCYRIFHTNAANTVWRRQVMTGNFHLFRLFHNFISSEEK